MAGSFLNSRYFRFFFIVVCVLAFLLVAGFLYSLQKPREFDAREQLTESIGQQQSAAPLPFDLPKDRVVVKTQDGRDIVFEVEMALTREHQQRGLMWRESLDENAGMLFVFDDVRPRSFWMKNTLIPLDIIHISPDGTVVQIIKNAKPRDETSLPGLRPAKAVLEIGGGVSDRLGIQENDKVLHSVFGNILADP